MKINLRPSFLPKSTRAALDPVPRAYKPWLLASLAVLLLSLVLLALVVGVSFAYFAHAGTPLWVVVLGVLAVLGVGLGFTGFLGMMLVAGWNSFRESKRVQVLPPE